MTRTLVASVLVLSAAALAILAAQPSAPVRSVSADVGRYQLVINPQIRADTFLLDTATGRIWTPGRELEYVGDPRVWEPETKVDSAAQLSAFLSTQTLKPK